ncbi:hypothetical protein F4802DRAFT_604323 [Xylaria palmicola]|nr:hypothetical protein F4802DRAFT_604323 [Xylaria palmicola]
MACPVCKLPIAEAAHPETRSSSRECPFCAAVFSRVDSARRHAKRCPERGGRALLARKRGRKTKSCDQCSRVKVHCDAGRQGVCERCASRGLACSFSRYCGDAAHRQHAGYEEEPPGAQDADARHSRAALSFLLDSTDDKQDFIAETAVAEEPDANLLGPTRVAPPQSHAPGDETLDYIDPSLLLPSGAPASLGPLELGGLYHTEEQTPLGAFASPIPREDLLAARLDLLELHVAAHANSSHHSKVSFDSAAFRSFFTVSNVFKFAMIFCRKRHYRYPVIHWPTFALEEASLPLLMVVSLTGATYSYRPGHGPGHITNARKLYHLADFYVFHHLAVCLGDLAIPGGTNLAEAIQSCQAALLMYGLDTFLAGDSAMQQVAIAERLPALVSALRRLQFINCCHSPLEDWQLFAQRETIVRLVAWTFGAECLVTLACNNPPILSITEMTGDLPCDPALWDADSATTFDLLKPSRQSISYCLRDLMSSFLDDDWREDSKWESFPIFHLHIMLCAFQQIIFNLHATMSLARQSEKMLQAFRMWRYLWERAIDNCPETQRKWLGVAKNLPDIEYLSRRIIEVSVGPAAVSSRYLQRVPSYGAREIHEFIRDLISTP